MSWPRVSLLASLLVIALPQAFADAIKVTTTSDDSGASVCSLRSAVEYFNQGRPEAGWNGCKRDGDSSSTDSIILSAESAAYTVNGSAILIRTDRNLSFTGGGSSGEAVTRIKANGPHRVFVLNNSATYAAPACAGTSSCQPAGAPTLDPASDTGVSPTDFLTLVVRPVFKGVATAPSNPSHTVRVILYAKRVDMAEKKQVGIVLADATTYAWTLTPDDDITPGEYQFSYATQLLDSDGNKVGSEVPSTAVTTLRVYADSAAARTISLTNMAIEGCGSNCAGNVDDTSTVTLANGLTYTNALSGTLGHGGVIYSTEGVSLSGSVVSKGDAAANGGAIYVKGSTSSLAVSTSTLSENTAAGNGGAIYTDAGVGLSIEGSLLEKNKAATGAAIYVADDTMTISSSAIIKNEATIATGAAIASGTATSTLALNNSTISGNTGKAVSLNGGTISSSTIVENTAGGVDFNAVTATVRLSILAGNGATDCENLPGTLTMTYSLIVTTGGCPAGGTGMQTITNTAGTDQQLMACDPAVATCTVAMRLFGLLNPLSVGEVEDKLLPYHMPRMLSSYTGTADSPLINKGNSTTAGCPGLDQRAKTRMTDATDYCDIGAIEVKATTEVARSGGSISYNAVYTGKLDQGLGDEELLDPSKCPATAPVIGAIGYRNDVPGCPWLETQPPRGTVAFNTDGTYSYTPNAPFHGYDEFRFRVMTTLSHLNTEASQRGRSVLAKVIVEPTSGITESGVGGSVGYGVLGMLSLLGLLRARRAGVAGKGQ